VSSPPSFPTYAIKNPNVFIAISLPPDPPSPTLFFPPDLRTQIIKLPCSALTSLSSHALSPIHAKHVPQVMQKLWIRNFRSLSVARQRKDVFEGASLVCSSLCVHVPFFYAITSDFSFFGIMAQTLESITATLTDDKHFSSRL
jgi:hypothetical protein